MPKDIFESYSAFANTDGGMIYLGVKELKDRSFHAHGIENPDPLLDDLWNQLNNPQKVSRNLLTPDMVRRFPSASGRRIQFGESFEKLGHDGRLAVATAKIEGFLNHARLQQLCSLHRRDITSLLQGLVNSEFLVPDGQGRGTTYRVSGAEIIDSAARSSHLNPRSEHLNPRSEHLSPRSEHLSPRSEGSAPRSEGSALRSEGSAPRSEDYDPVKDPILQEMARPVSSKSRIGTDIFRNTLLRLCSARFLTLNELAALMNRNPVDLRQRYIKPMVDVEKVLERRFPQQPNHEQQAYRTREP